MKLNKFKKMIMIGGAILAITPVAIISTAQTNLQTVQASIPRNTYYVLTKPMKSYDYGRVNYTTKKPYIHFDAGTIMIINPNSVMYMGHGNYDDVTNQRRYKLTKSNSKRFTSFKRAKAYSKKHFKKFWHEIYIENNPKIQAKLEKQREKKAQEKYNRERDEALAEQRKEWEKDADEADREWNNYINGGSVENDPINTLD